MRVTLVIVLAVQWYWDETRVNRPDCAHEAVCTRDVATQGLRVVWVHSASELKLTSEHLWG